VVEGDIKFLTFVCVNFTPASLMLQWKMKTWKGINLPPQKILMLWQKLPYPDEEAWSVYFIIRQRSIV